MVRNNVLLENKFILYGMGVSNKSVKKFFDKHNIDYIIVEEDYEVTNDYIVIKSPGIPNDTVFLNNTNKKWRRNLLLVKISVEYAVYVVNVES